MSLLSKLFGKNKNTVSDETLIEAQVCPNCWGSQEYDNQFIDFVEDQTKSNISGDKSHQKAFVQQFVETSVTGIHLKKEGDHLSCPKCKRKIKNVSSQAN